jgi:Na+/H+ antiporter NhaD/arsenite permease-like protein
MVVQTPAGPHIMNFICFLTFLVFIVIFGLIIWEKIPRMYLAVCGAVFVIVLGVFDIKEAIDTVSWETIGFLLGMFLLIEILVEAGFFRYVSLVLAKRLNYEPLKILVFFPLLSFGLSAFINSITVMVFLTVATLELSRLLKFDPVPVVVSEVVLSNIGGAGTLVGDPPNVILGTILGFNFNDFLIHNAPIAIVSGLAAVGMSFLMNKKVFSHLHTEVDLDRVKSIEPRSQIKDRFLLKVGLGGMAVALIFLIGRPLFERLGIPINVSTSSLLPAFVILTFGGQRVYKHHFMRRIDAETIIFFIGLFILIGALEKRFIIQMAANFLGDLFKTPTGFVSSIFWGTGIISAFVDNVPLAMAMTFIIKQSVASKIVPGAGILVWATSLGVDLGGNLTPIGASANVVAYSGLEKEGVKIGWLRWLRLALPQGLIALVISYIGILMKLKLGWF